MSRALLKMTVAGSVLLLVLSLAACGAGANGSSSTSEVTPGSLAVTTTLPAASTDTTAASSTDTTAAPSTETSSPATTSDTAGTTPPTVSSEMGSKFGQTQKVWGCEITIGKPVLDPGEPFIPAGKVICAVLVTIKNTASDKRPYDPLFFSAVDTKGNKYLAVNSTQMITKLKGLGAGDLAPGDNIVQGYMGVQVPEGASIASVTLNATNFGGTGSATWSD